MRDLRSSEPRRARSLLTLLLLIPQSVVAQNATLHARIVSLLQEHAVAIHPQARIDPMFALPENLRPPCLQPTLQRHGSGGAQRATVRLRCPERAWSAFVPVGAGISVPVLIARRSITRGEPVRKEDFVEAYRSLDALRADPILPDAPWQPWELRSQLAPGRVLYTRHVQPATLIRRGDRVRISSRRGTARIVTLGEALRAGHLGEQIQVENLSSGREIRAWVTARGQVSVQAPGL